MPSATKTEAWNHYRDVVEPELQGRSVARRDLTLSELVDVFLDHHGKVRSPRTVRTLRERMKRPLDQFGDVPLVELERMTDEVADFIGHLPDRWRHPVVLAFRQTLDAGTATSRRIQRSSQGRTRSRPPGQSASTCRVS
jgi:hypothetical protein